MSDGFTQEGGGRHAGPQAYVTSMVPFLYIGQLSSKMPMSHTQATKHHERLQGVTKDYHMS